MAGDVADLLAPGDRVEVNSFEGFGGPGVVEAVRPVPGGRCKVRLDDGSQSPFWAHDFELAYLPPAGDDDSRPATLAHIAAVRERIGQAIADLLRGASLAACRHSNVAVDAVVAGVPFEAVDGAAMWLAGKDYTPANRLDFLRRLAWWQWKASEAHLAWDFAKEVARV